MFLLCMHTNHDIHMLLTFIHTTLCMLMCTLVHIVDARATLQNFVMIGYMIQIFANRFVWVRKGANPHGPKRVWVSKSTPILFDVGVGSRLT